MHTIEKLTRIILVCCLTGCVVTNDELDIDEALMPLVSHNALSSNALSSNALSSNALSSNALSSNALSSNQLSPTMFELNTAASMGMELTESGRAVLTYLVRCALPQGIELVVTVDNVEYHFPGVFNIVPEWLTEAVDTSKKYAMSACLLAHVNAFGVSVSISGRLDGIEDVSADEADRFTTFEGAFFGNIFALNQKMYACMGDSAPDFTVEYPNHDTTSGDRLLRRCTDPTEATSSTTECGFVYVGYCSDVCDVQRGGSYFNCWNSANRHGTMYADTMNVWLYAYDDPGSVWPELYSYVYDL